MHNLGQTRSSHKHNHLLQTADTFVRTTLPDMKACAAIVHASPALGARFTQYTAEFESGGELGSTAAQRFLFVLEGQLKLDVDGQPERDGTPWLRLLTRRLVTSSGRHEGKPRRCHREAVPAACLDGIAACNHFQ